MSLSRGPNLSCRLSGARLAAGAVCTVFLLLIAGLGCGVAGPQNETAASDGWKVIGPGGGGGLFDPTIDPADSKHVLMRCDMTGAYVTRDNGQRWDIFNLWTVITDFEFDPDSSGTVYASTRGYLHDQDRGSGLSLLCRSEDGGTSWEIVYPDPSRCKPVEKLQNLSLLPSQLSEGLPDCSIDRVRVDPADSKMIYLGMSPLTPYIPLSRVQPEGQAVLMASADRGATWRQVAKLPGSKVLTIIPQDVPGRPGELTVITNRACVGIKVITGEMTMRTLPLESVQFADGGVGKNGSLLYVMSSPRYSKGKLEGGLFRSRDWGATWEPVNQGILDCRPGERINRFSSLGVCANAPENVYLAAYTQAPDTTANGKPVQLELMYRTRDGGSNWKTVYLSDGHKVLSNNFEGSWLNRDYGPGWGGVPISMGVSPSDPEVCYGTDYGRAYSTLDGGATWKQVYSVNHPDGSYTGTGLDVTCCYGVHFDPFDAEHLAISYIDAGLFQSFDGGKDWLHTIEGIPENWVNTCYWVEYDPQVQDRMWSAWANVHALPRQSQFAPGRFEKGDGGVAVSEDGGRSWRVSTQGMPEHSVATHVLVDPDSPPDARIVYACVFDRGVYKSVDGGASWSLKAEGLGEHPYAWETRLVDDRLYLLCVRGWPDYDTVVNGGLYVSADGAESWKRMDLPAGLNAPLDLLIDPTDQRRMYLSCWPTTVDSVDVCGGVYRTDDGGRSWKQVFDQSCRVYAAALDPRDPSIVYLNTFQNAAWRSDDRGEHWKRLEGYRFKWGHRPVPDPHHPGMIYLTTYGGSVYYGPSEGVPNADEGIKNMPQSWW